MLKGEQGIRRDRYQVIPRTLIFITDEDRILLIKGAPDKRIWANRYNGIGGHIERGEDILSAARRELLEESGLTVSDIWLCGIVIVDATDLVGIGIFIFRGEYEGGDLAHTEEGELVWVARSDLASLPLVEDLPILLPKVLAMKTHTTPFAALTYYDDQDQLQIRFT